MEEGLYNQTTLPIEHRSFFFVKEGKGSIAEEFMKKLSNFYTIQCLFWIMVNKGTI